MCITLVGYDITLTGKDDYSPASNRDILQKDGWVNRVRIFHFCIANKINSFKKRIENVQLYNSYSMHFLNLYTLFGFKGL